MQDFKPNNYMKNPPIFIVANCLACFLVSCASPKTYTTATDWDSNKNGSIERREFVEAYLAQNYFDKWGEGKGSVAYQDLFNSLFDAMDVDKDKKLSIAEFNAQIKLFYFGLFSGSFVNWDDDRNESLSQDEFNKHISSSNLASIWDTNDDNRISEREMAGGMFYLCDADSNGSVSETELDAWKKNR